MKIAHRALTGRGGRTLVLAAALVALVLVGRALANHSIDFVVYRQAALSLLAGRVDLYADDFALQPPMRYVYPPLFVLLVSPLGFLSFADGYGIWFALSTLITLVVACAAWQEWSGGSVLLRTGVLLGLAGPFVVYGLRSGNVHLPVVMLATGALVAWSRRREGSASLLLAVAGAVKVFPLFLLLYFAVMRQWRLVVRTLALSVVLWLLPVVHFGPTKTIELYRQWFAEVGADVERLRRESRLDVSLVGACGRWFTEVDYSRRIDPSYPQVGLIQLDAPTVAMLARFLVLAIGMLALIGTASLGLARGGTAAERSAGIASLWMATQLLVGPYTTLLYLGGWIVPALALPLLLRDLRLGRRALVSIAIASLLVVLVPGSARHRALEAAGVHTLLGVGLWILSLVAVRSLRRRSTSRGTACRAPTAPPSAG